MLYTITVQNCTKLIIILFTILLFLPRRF